LAIDQIFPGSAAGLDQTLDYDLWQGAIFKGSDNAAALQRADEGPPNQIDAGASDAGASIEA
jgi:hypothetical protein